MEIVIGIIQILAALFLIGAVLMQSGKSHNLSGTIAGGAETFFGKSKATTIVAIVFVVLVLVSYLVQNHSSYTAAPAADYAVETLADAD